MKYLSLVVSLGLVMQQSVQAEEVSPCIEGDACTLALYSETAGQWQFINSERAKQAFAPYSTFKIANTLILLESGQVNTTARYQIDLNRYPAQDWWFKTWREPDQNLKSAFDYSVLPLYRQWSADLGRAAYEQFIQQFSYGNQDVSGPVDGFWLGDSLQISAVQQVEFLRKYQHQQLGLKASTYRDFSPIFLQRQDKQARLFAKTGGGMLAKGQARGWYVGMVENQQGMHYFAFNMDADSFKSLAETRIKKALASLQSLKVTVPE
ncbi:penicillin-binding transpeptidase domain-containing protein [Bowmanella denitrificans]|uniref:penicillin-binding transpeptidase domain-containing protein n=1 Tax=Bowmanella denitrificans TaxID=366582 RepID=UPI000C99B34D|nr:penicillin-binding transpeptidase domain-containing protein [Bowmanella denitrificans]